MNNLSTLRRLFSVPWAIREQEFALFPQLLMEPKLAGDFPGRPGKSEKPIMATSWKLVYWDEERNDFVRDKYPTQKGYEVFNYEGLLTSLRGTLPEVRDGVTVLLIWGPLGRGWTAVDRYWLDPIETDEIQQVLSRVPEGNEIVLWFRSPGGVVTGVPELGAFIRQFAAGRKVTAFTDDLCASAAYWLAAQCGSIVATPTAQVGSIGVYFAYYDYCGYLEKSGIELHLWKAGEEKGDGVIGNPVSKQMDARMQKLVSDNYDRFTAAVTEMRAVDSSSMQGQCFYGDEAMERNLVDRFTPSAQEFLESLSV